MEREKAERIYCELFDLATPIDFSLTDARIWHDHDEEVLRVFVGSGEGVPVALLLEVDEVARRHGARLYIKENDYEPHSLFITDDRTIELGQEIRRELEDEMERRRH